MNFSNSFFQGGKSFMKKVMVIALSACLALSFCAAASAVGHDVGHVGHIDMDLYQDTIDTCDIIFTPEETTCECIVSVSGITGDDISMPDGTYTVFFLAGVHVEYDGPRNGVLTIDVRSLELNPDGILIKNISGTYDYFPVIDGVATIPNVENYLTEAGVLGGYLNPAVASYETDVYLVDAEQETGGGGGGGCSVSAFSPLMALLLAPLMLLKK